MRKTEERGFSNLINIVLIIFLIGGLAGLANLFLKKEENVNEIENQEEFLDNNSSNSNLCSNDKYSTWENVKGRIELDIESGEVLRAEFKERGAEAFKEIEGLTCINYFSRPSPAPDMRDLSSLSKLKNLETIILQGSKIKDLTPLEGLDKVQYLDLSDNVDLKEINSLKELTSLRKLDISNNDISDISSLSNLTNLEWLRMSYNFDIEDVESLSNLQNLKYLNLGSTSVSDLSPLLELKNLENLRLAGCYDLEEADVLEKMIWLKSLNIYDSSVLRNYGCDYFKEKLPDTQVVCTL